MLSDKIQEYSSEEKMAQMVLQNQLVPLLSDQLYRSPIKAIEELVVNSYDADAKQCRLFVPTPAELAKNRGNHFIVVFDDGEGMGVEEFITLWNVGLSPKTATRKLRDRKQIGKFGIGKLATYAVAFRLTYVSKTKAGIFTSGLNYHDLDGSLGAKPKESRAPTPVRRITDWKALAVDAVFVAACKAAHVTEAHLKRKSWTLVILEDLKPKAEKVQQGRLKWVLRTAMPLKAEFKLYLGGEEVTSSKADIDPVVEFGIKELPKSRLDSLNESSLEKWRKSGDKLVSQSFPLGITGTVAMTSTTLTGKSDDLERSHGFFIYVLDRLVNLEDAHFGMPEQSYKYFHRFVAVVHADDLDETVVAAREGVELSEQRTQLVRLLREIFSEARQRFNAYVATKAEDERGKNEDSRDYVPPQMVEFPVADVLSFPAQFREGADVRAIAP